jgi:hypothetical protein
MQRSSQDRRQLQAAIRQAYPNPERAGCPAPDVLEKMARRTVSLRPVDRDHIFHCSPCFETYLGIRNQIGQRRFIWITSAAIVAMLLLGAATYFWFNILRRPPQQFAAAFNLQERPVFRGPDQAAIQSSPFVLPRGIVHLTITLPLGSEPGAYRIGVFNDGRAEPLLSSGGTATVRTDGSTVLEVILNSARLRAGQYAFGVSKDHSEWSYSPLIIR